MTATDNRDRKSSTNNGGLAGSGVAFSLALNYVSLTSLLME